MGHFVSAANRYHDQTGNFPYTNGMDNLVLSLGGTPELTLLDTGPITGQLSALFQALNIIR